MATTADRVTMCDCGHAPERDGARGIGTGYGVSPNGRTSCYACCNAAERETMRTADRMFAYLSGDGNTVQTWPGGVLGTVTRETKRTMYGFCVSERTFVRVRAFDGSTWHGQGPGRGMYVRLRRCSRPEAR